MYPRAMRYLLGLITIASACADEGAGGDSGIVGAEPVALSELCAVVTDSMCTAMIHCAGWNYRDLEHCRQDQTCWGMDVLTAAIEAGEVRYDPALVGECRAIFEAQPCLYGLFFDVPTVDEMLAACWYIRRDGYGTVPAGSPCTTVLSCDRDSTCVFDGACPGTCQALAPAGTPCGAETGAVCDFREGLRCVSTTCESMPFELTPCDDDDDCNGARCRHDLATFGMCDPGVGEGEACGVFDGPDCGLSLGCDLGEGSFQDGTGRCRPPSSEGQWCNDALYCAEGLACHVDLADQSNNRCGPPRGPGAPCNSDADCGADTYCDFRTPRTCAAKVAAGGACDGSTACDQGLVCELGLCLAAAYPGESCDDTRVCQLSRCQGGACMVRSAVGAPCMVDDDCCSDACEQNVCLDPNGCG